MKLLSIFFKFIILISSILAVTQTQASTPLDITIHRNGVQLKGKFYIPDETGRFPTVILLHGFPGNEMDVLGIGNKLSEVDISALTFNYSGTHHSEGEFNFENTQKDIEAVFQFIHESDNIHKYKIDTTRIFLGGYSYGGGMALTYVANHPEIKAVFSIAGNDHGEFMKEYNRNPEMQKIIDKMFNELNAPTGPVRFGKGGTVKEIAEMGIIELNPTFHLRKSAPLLAQKNILLIAGWDDNKVSIDNIILPLYRELNKEKSQNVRIVAFQDNHSFKNSRAKLAQTIIKWINEN